MRQAIAARLSRLSPEERQHLLHHVPPSAQRILMKAFPEAQGMLSGSTVVGGGGQMPMMARGGAVSGMGGGLDDLVPANIDGRQPAALSSGEFVMPADAVSAAGDGSTEHGARKLQALVDGIRQHKGLPRNPKPMRKGLSALMGGR